MLSFIVQRSFVTINSQCRAFMAVKSLGGSLLCYKNTPHTSYFPKPVHTIYSGPVRHLWPLIICEWFEMFGKHWGLCMKARSPWRPSSVWSAVMGGSCGEVTREIWLKSSHWRPHTNFRDVTFHPNRQVNQSKRVFIVSLYSSSISDRKERNTSTRLFYVSLLLWSEPQHDKWQGPPSALLSPLTPLSLKSNLENIGSWKVGSSFEISARLTDSITLHSSLVTILPAHFVECVEKNYHKFTVTETRIFHQW